MVKVGRDTFWGGGGRKNQIKNQKAKIKNQKCLWPTGAGQGSGTVVGARLLFLIFAF
jgi:hypothetical protein